MYLKTFVIKNYLFIISAFYLLLGFALLPYYVYQTNPDFISYTSVSFRYLHHDYLNAVNGGWAPMVSWLLIPFLFFKIDPPLAFLILNLLGGFVSLLIFNKLISLFTLSLKAKLIGVSVSAVILLQLALSYLTPDLLTLSVLLAMLYIAIKNFYNLTYKNAILLGMLGAVGYFCKSYTFGFFLLYFTFFSFLDFFFYKKNQRAKIITSYLLGLTFFFIVSAPWIAALSIKYKTITFSTAKAYNHAIMGPGKEGKYDISNDGLMAPSDPIATSAFETFADMSHYHGMQDWSPFSSVSSFFHQVKITSKNIYLTVAKLEVINPLSVFIVLFIVIELIRKRKLENITRTPLFFILVFISVYISGYLLLRIQDRYLWIINLSVLLFSLHIIDKIITKEGIKNKLFFLIVLSFCIPAFINAKHMFNAGKEITIFSSVLNEKKIKGNLASNSEYSPSLQLSYKSHNTYFGCISRNKPDSVIRNELKENKIDYLLCWDKGATPSFLNACPAIAKDSLLGLKIFQLKLN